MLEEWIVLLLVGIVAGIMSGMFGIGGGAIIVPALILFLDFTQVQANGTSLAALLLPVGVLACISYYRQGKLRLAPAFLVAIGLAGGVWFGAGVALDLPADTLRQSYGIFLLYMAWRYISPRKWWQEWRKINREDVQEDTDLQALSAGMMALMLGVGVLAGLASGMFGIGGGVVIVPALMSLAKFDQKLATGTSLGALLLPVGLPGAIRYYEAGQLEIMTAVPIALMLLVFGLVGANLALSLPTKTVKRLYGFFLLFVGIRFLFGA